MKKSTGNLYQRLRKIIERTPPGERLPSEPALSKMLEVSRATLRETMQSFETEGWIRRQQGVGTFVVHSPKVIESGLEVLESLETLAERIGLKVYVDNLRLEVVKPNVIEQKMLQITEDEKIIKVSRAINADGKTVAYLIDKLPVSVFSINDIPNGFTGSVLDLLLKKRKPLLANSKCEISAINADEYLANYLNVGLGVALLKLTSLLYSVEGMPIDYSHSYFVPGFFNFHVVRSVGKKQIKYMEVLK